MQSATTTLLAAAMVLATGCASVPATAEPTKKSGGDKPAAASPGVNTDDLYLVYHEHRVYVFDDTPTYLSFLANGETPFTLTRIGGGPKGETVVFGLSAKDKKKRSGLGCVDLYDGKITGADGFYGEIVRDQRVFVFGAWKDMKDFMTAGEAPFTYTDIGAGPKGETLVFVLNKGNKKHKPVQLIETFRARHSKG